LPERIHESLVKAYYQGEIVGQNSRDFTAIEAREKSLKKVPKKKGRPKKGEERIKEPTRLEQQATGMDLHNLSTNLLIYRYF